MSDAYQLLDSGNLCKLEQAGPYRLVRPALNAFWKPRLPEAEWSAADAVFTRRSDGSGAWKTRNPLPPDWHVRWGNFTLKVKQLGHTNAIAKLHEKIHVAVGALLLSGAGAEDPKLFGLVFPRDSV